MGRLAEKEVGGVRVIGFSLAGEESVVAAPELNVCFDVGRAPGEIISIDNICLSHGHMDHAAGIAYYLSQRSFIGNAPGRIILHRGLASAIQQLMGVWADIEGHPSPGQILGVDTLEDVTLRRGLLVRPFAVNHTPTALGFTLIEVRHKLKPEYHGKSGPQLVALKRDGVEIEGRIEVPLLTYSGDTAMGRWIDHSFVRQSSGILLECTFFEKDHVHRARAGKHMHVIDLPKLLEAIPDSQILLTHVTRRTDLRLAKRILESTLSPRDLKRTSFLMDRSQRNSRRQPTTSRKQADSETPVR